MSMKRLFKTILGNGLVSDLVKLPPNLFTDRVATMFLNRIKDSEIRTRYGYSIRFLRTSPESTGIRKAVVLGKYEKSYLGVLARLVRTGDYVIDVGAHEGYISLFLSHIVGKRGRVFAIEPNFENVSFLLRNINLNHVDNITVINKAISDNCGKGDFYYSNGDGAWGSLTHYPDFKTDKVATVDVDSLDNLFCKPEYRGKIKLCKLDIQGNEMKAISGAEQLIAECHPHIAFEVCLTFWAYHDMSIETEFDFLRSRGYELFVVKDNQLSPYEWLNERIMNIIAIHQSERKG